MIAIPLIVLGVLLLLLFIYLYRDRQKEDDKWFDD